MTSPESMDSASIFHYVVQAGSFGLVAWMFFHIHTKIIPSFLNTINLLASGFQASVEKMVSKFADEMSRERDAARNERNVEILKMAVAFDKLEQVVVAHDRDMRAYHANDHEILMRRVLMQEGLIKRDGAKSEHPPRGD